MRAIELRDITKRFPNVIANDRVSLEVEENEVHALVGENGAGKTTLMNILYGLYQPDEGNIFVNGKEVRIKSPYDAIDHGIGMVHQHFTLISRFNVVENIVLGRESKRGFFFDREESKRRVLELSKRFGLKTDPDAIIEELSVGEQQRVEILKVLYRDAKIIIMDEPTAVLTPQEIEELYGIIDFLKRGGKTIIFITHKLKEVMRVADRVTVLRNGKTIATMEKSEIDTDSLARMIVGKEIKKVENIRKGGVGEKIFEVNNLHALGPRGNEVLKGLNLEIKKGEIVGLAGVEGNGQKELIEVITGLRKCFEGSVSFNETEITNRTPQEIKERGIAHIPADRIGMGMIMEFSLYENLIFGLQKDFTSHGVIKYDKTKEYAKRVVEEFDVRPRNVEAKIKKLSGGNQQKIVLAREMSTHPELLIANQPTRGLDVGASEFVYEKIFEARDKGAVLLVSSDLDEIIDLSDRIAVIFDGGIVAGYERGKVTQEQLGYNMMGGIKEKGVKNG
jgi:simple sugar transport system ATP-binding protein